MKQVFPIPEPEPKKPTFYLGSVALDWPLVGRTMEVTALLEALEKGGAAAIVNGEGGINKTNLARAYVDSHDEKHDGVL